MLLSERHSEKVPHITPLLRPFTLQLVCLSAKVQRKTQITKHLPKKMQFEWEVDSGLRPFYAL